MPRWWKEGGEWLAGLPGAVEEQCARWGLRITGEVAHGSNAVVVPVVRDGVELALRMSPPGDEVAAQVRALRWWNGRGTVRLYDADAGRGAMLLERLGESLAERPVGESMQVLGRLMRRLAVPAPADALSTADIVATRSAELERDWQALGRPFDESYLIAALRVAGSLAVTDSQASVDGDLHADQVLRDIQPLDAVPGRRREPWLVVDPVLLRGDVEFDLARILWTRLDEMGDDAEILQHFATAVGAAGLDRRRARDWIVFRTVDYWLWGLTAGLTEDPVRCHRLLDAFLP